MIWQQPHEILQRQRLQRNSATAKAATKSCNHGNGRNETKPPQMIPTHTSHDHIYEPAMAATKSLRQRPQWHVTYFPRFGQKKAA